MAQARVHSAPTAAVAEMLKDILAQHGIAATTRRSPSLLGTLSGLTEVWIEDEDDLSRAREVVEEFLAGPGEPQGWRWWCPGCGEPVEAQFTECWRCGTSRPG